MKKTTRKTPQSVKTQRKIEAAVDEALKNQQTIVVNHAPQPIQVPSDSSHIFPLLDKPKSQMSLLPVKGSNGLLIPNANQGWKLFSNLAFASIIASQAFFANLDPEMIAALPDNIQYYVTAIQAVVGIAARLINQTKRKGVANV